MTVDPLAEIVTLLQPTARFSKLVECAGSWRIHREMTRQPFYCAVLEGCCRVSINGQPFMVLEAGDFVLVPAMHDLINESLNAPPDGVTTRPIEISEGCFRVGSKNGPAELRMRIGHCSFGSADAELLVPLLPQMVLAREPRLATLMQLVGDETRARRPARELMLERLLEVLLIEALRCGAETGSSVPGLARGLADNRLAAALCALHARPEYPWTVAELAAEAALSRSAFFARFGRAVGLPPLGYLLTWRMALAKRLLCERELSIDQVAARVGYSSASTFSIAFARHAGAPPARYARMRRQGKHPTAAAAKLNGRPILASTDFAPEWQG
ncbi:AraC family transcriptional regulator [Rhizobium sp. P40RR-XXII]|uniref:AraC family transcriptional regulator n=1 Tax=Rhizobium sp. P40RR-XXII TaxID=2726739 RepID=UPI0014577CDE|nr:AraC family transcriptional regulator [Rhizobium sp. P40RR-XXII]NLS20281.1 AraC family transcriptional regulator [Rhizobium sp. P40RR-XXII]